MAAILIVEDDNTFSQLLESYLQRNDFATATAGSITEAKQLIGQQSYDLILLDYRLPDGTGIEILEQIRSAGSDTPVIIMTSFYDIRTVVQTMRCGASDFITKPVNQDELLLTIRQVLHKKQQPAVLSQPMPEYIKGISAGARQLYEYIELVAPTDFSVIIQGESGTGKEQAARSIHDLSRRKNAPFVALDCGALSAELAGSELFGHIKGAFTGALQNKKGLFEMANGGTLFLDEVGNLSYEVQVKLLRAIQEREIQPIGSNTIIKVDTRIICATNDNLLNSVNRSKFREDLYHRLNEFSIQIPALRERVEDIPLFIDFFIAHTNRELQKNITGASPQVMDLLKHYDWPGNLRELKNIIKRAVLLANGNEITTADLPQEMLMPMYNNVQQKGLKDIQSNNERELIIETLKKAKFNKSKAAKLLNIDRTTLYYKIAKYRINEELS